MPELLSTEQLLTLYKIALEEYRFQVRLNCDRTAYHLTLNSGLVAIATGLLKFGSASPVNLAVAAVFFIGMCASAIGIKTIRKGHEYYRHPRRRFTKYDCPPCFRVGDDTFGNESKALREHGSVVSVPVALKSLFRIVLLFQA